MKTRREAMTTAATTGAAALGLGALAATASGAGIQSGNAAAGPTKLFSLWTSGDPDVAHRVALMYTHAAKRNGWFAEVKLVLWGPCQRIFVSDKDIKAKVEEMRADGVVVEACIACSESFGLTEELKSMGLTVIGQGGPLSDALKDPATAVTFF